MGKKKILVEARTKEERIEQRQKLGSLHSLTVQPATKKRYESALSRFFDFLKLEGIVLPRQKDALDDLVSEYLEFLWSSGEGRALASDTLAGLENLEQHLKGHLATSWRLLKVWHQNEMPNRAPPFPEKVLQALVGKALVQNDHAFALSLLLGFYGMMRTGEILCLEPWHVAVPKDNGPAIISLGLTKAGKRQGAAESITISVSDVVRRLRQWKAATNKPLVSSATQWRAQFSQSLNELGLSEFQFRPYSLRRGGATFWFQKHGSFDRLMVQGRWHAQKTARIYINSGVAALAEMRINPANLQGFLSVYSSSLRQDLPSLEHTRQAGSSGGRGKKVMKVIKRECDETRVMSLNFSNRCLRPSFSPTWRRGLGRYQGFSRPDCYLGLPDRIREILEVSMGVCSFVIRFKFY